MKDKKTIAVRYCGGCNPRYDRVNTVRSLEKLFPEYSFVPAYPGNDYSLILIICGCSARCVNVSDLSESVLYLDGLEENLSTAVERLRLALVKD